MSLYWDDFERRIIETTEALKKGDEPPVRRVAVFITNKCNFRCKYCRVKFGYEEMGEKIFDQIVKTYPNAIIHITGGEPSIVRWLYNYLEHHQGRFHLNTNAYIKPPLNIQRAKISLDSCEERYINNLVGVKDAFGKIIKHIKFACGYTTTSITCVLSKQNYMGIPKMVDFCNKEFSKLYALFFSIYKGVNPDFLMDKDDVDRFFEFVKPTIKPKLNQESLWLLNETLDEKFRILQGKRFPENKINNKCYLSLSERVFNYKGEEYRCSHLFRDGVFSNSSLKTQECEYGCNRKLVKFNQTVEAQLAP